LSSPFPWHRARSVPRPYGAEPDAFLT